MSAAANAVVVLVLVAALLVVVLVGLVVTLRPRRDDGQCDECLAVRGTHQPWCSRRTVGAGR